MKIKIVAQGLSLNNTADLIEILSKVGIEFEFIPITEEEHNDIIYQPSIHSCREDFVAMVNNISTSRFAQALIEVEQQVPEIQFKLPQIIKAEHEYNFYNKPSKEEIRDSREQHKLRQSAHKYRKQFKLSRR